MNEKVAEARRRLNLAQDMYRRALNGVDGQLRAAVSQDPKNLGDAKAVQADYPNHGFVVAALAERQQPEPSPNDPTVVEAADTKEEFFADLGRPADAQPEPDPEPEKPKRRGHRHEGEAA